MKLPWSSLARKLGRCGRNGVRLVMSLPYATELYVVLSIVPHGAVG